MPITSKKLLSSLAALSVVGLSVSSVVACGFNLDKIRNRSMATDVYNSVFSYPVTSYNTAYTMQSEDQLVLANTNATLVSIDQYGRLYGDIFQSNEDPKSASVGETTDSKTWTYKVRDNLKWKKYDGTAVADIKASDLYKTAYFALNSKVTGSAVGSLWRGFILGAEEVTTYLSGLTTPTFELFMTKINEMGEGFGLKCDDSAKTVTFTLTKAAPYFESLIAYSAFSPIYDEKSDQVTDFKKGYYSGAYLPKEVTSTKMSLAKNDDYQFASEVTVKEINYVYAGNGGVQATRTLFEAGDINGFGVSSADAVGWNRYVGSDVENPLFDQAYDVPSARQTSTFVLYFNTYNSKVGNSTSGQYVNASKLLQFADARALLATGIDRSDFVRYYSTKYDGENPVSSMLRNTYTSPTVGINDGTDYTQYLAEKADPTGGKNSTKLADGTDYLLNNSKDIIGKTREELIASIKSYLSKEGIEGKVKLEFLLNSEQNATLNPYLKMMFDKFNKIENNPIEVVTVDSTSAADYQARANEGAFDIYSGGWGPDYADPATFLNTMTIGGDLNNYTGTNRFLTEENKLSNENLRSSVTDEYINAHVDYTNTFNTIDSTVVTNTDDRFTQFAELEYDLLYKNFMFMPMYKAALPKNFIVSHVIPYSTTYISTYGISNYKLFTQRISEKLLTKDELTKVFADYAAGLEEVKKDVSWKKSESVFWK